MLVYNQNESYKLYHGNMLDMLSVIEKESIDSIVTDPPYELNFMNKGWDNSGISFQNETWQRCFDVLKPGGYLLAFGGSRTFHRIACKIEDAGFEIRDTIMWLYGSGFPKSMNIGLAIDKKNGVDNKTGNKSIGVGCHSGTAIEGGDFQKLYEERIAQNEWSGWGTCLKPAYEPIIVARKPCVGSCVDNVIKYGVGGINIDECKIGDEMINVMGGNKFPNLFNKYGECKKSSHNGRFPANVILTYDDTDFDEVCGGMPYTKGNSNKRKRTRNNVYSGKTSGGKMQDDIWADEGSAARYFYCAKASKKDRDEGLEELNKNLHPTVKPTKLMQYLVRLVTPNGGTILDPFNGSGSTGKAVMYENIENNKNYKYIGIELTKEYLPISKARIEYVMKNKTSVIDKDYKQIDIFDFLN